MAMTTSLVILLDGYISDMTTRLPRVVLRPIPQPLDKIFTSGSTAVPAIPVIKDVLNRVPGLIIKPVNRWWWQVWPLLTLLIRLQQTCVKNRMEPS
jgi:hypothetical protein